MRIALACLVAVLLATPAFAQDAGAYKGPPEKLHIYFLVGQSNMSGRARVEDQDRALPRNLFLLDSKSQWVPATHPFIQYTNVPNGADKRVLEQGGKTGLNVGLAFARRMLEASGDASIGLVVNSQGGSAIATWKKGAKGSNYDKTLERFAPARASGQVKGILWHQGEADMSKGEKYLPLLEGVIAQFRADLGNPDLPFVAGQIAPLPKSKDVIAAFNRALLELPRRVPHTGVASTEGFKGDDIHFGADETRELGRRYAAEMLRLQTKK